MKSIASLSPFHRLMRPGRNTHTWATFLLVVVVALSFILFACAVQSPTHAAATSALAAPASKQDFFSSIDTMKVSRDTETNPVSQDEIAQIIQVIKGLNTRYISVGTHWDYVTYMKEWTDAIHAAGLHVWFRGHPNQWENDNGATGVMTPSDYETAEGNFIEANPTLFQSGDIFDASSEPEQGTYWKDKGNWTSNAPNDATREFNAFLRDTTDVADMALGKNGVSGVITTIRSTNSFFPSNPNVLEAATVQKFGYVTFDSYPEQNTTDPTMATAARIDELTKIYNLWHVPIVLGEVGYSNDVNVDDATQDAVLKAEFAAISQLPYVVGLNYWVGPGSTTAGGYTYIIEQQNGKWVPRPAATELANYFHAENTADPVVTPTTVAAASPSPVASSSPITTPVSTTTPVPVSTSSTPTTYEAESPANILTGVARRNGCAACSGGMDVVDVGLISTPTGNVNSTLTFTITMSSAGSYELTIYYLNADPQRTADLSINGRPATTITFPQAGEAGDWSVVNSISVMVNLQQGYNTLTFSNPNAPAPNFDRIVV